MHHSNGLGALVWCAHDLWASVDQGGVICSGDMRASLTVKLMWNTQASRPHARALGHQRVTSYEATISGTDYGEHRKAAVGWTEERASAASGPYQI